MEMAYEAFDRRRRGGPLHAFAETMREESLRGCGSRDGRSWVLFLGVSLCGCSSANPAGGSAATSPASGLDGGGGSSSGPGLVTYQSACAGTAAASDTLTSTTLAFTLAYPPTWQDATTQSDLPTLRSNDEQGGVQGQRYSLGNPGQDPLAVIRSGAGSGVQSLPQPDIITIGLGLSMGSGEILTVLGTAPVTADLQVFCDIQAILETVTPTN
jgi:hypothetical protein